MQVIKKIISGMISSLGYSIKRAPNPYKDLIDYFSFKKKIIALDIGAYHGKFSLNLVKYFSKAVIYAFEPQDSDFVILEKKTKEYDNIIPYKLAISDFIGKASMFKTNFSYSSSLLRPDNKHFKELTPIGSEIIECTTLDHWLKLNDIKKVNLIKLDTQGLELIILQSIERMLSKIDIIFTELNFRPHYIGSTNFLEVYNYLNQNNFVLINLYNISYSKGKLLFCDSMFVNNGLINRNFNNIYSIDE